MAYADTKDGVNFSALSADTAAFTLLGGRYEMIVSATWGGGSVDLKSLMPDGSTYVTVLAAVFSADSAKILDLAPGTYKVVITTATAVQGAVARIPYRGA